MDKIEVSFPGNKRADAQVDGWTIHTDQSAAHGGGGSAPTPFSLFLTSLVTCAGAYALDFCQVRDIPTQELRLVLHVERDAKGEQVTGLELETVLPPEFPARYEKAILRAMDLCAVKKAIASPPPMELKTSRGAS